MSLDDISVFLLEDHAVLRDALAYLLAAEGGIHIVGSVASPAEFECRIEVLSPDVVVMGLIFSGGDALRYIADWSEAYPKTRFLVLSQLAEETYAPRVLNAGAHGYLMKTVSVDVLLAGIRTVAGGEVAVSPQIASQLLARFSSRAESGRRSGVDRLTDRELQVLTLIGQGCTTAAVATGMGISKKTVDTFKERIKAKLSLKNSTQLAQAAVQHLGRF